MQWILKQYSQRELLGPIKSFCVSFKHYFKHNSFQAIINSDQLCFFFMLDLFCYFIFLFLIWHDCRQNKFTINFIYNFTSICSIDMNKVDVFHPKCSSFSMASFSVSIKYLVCFQCFEENHFNVKRSKCYKYTTVF